MTENFVALADMDAWAEFWADNSAACEEQVGDEAACLALACNCSLMLGGGSSPLIRVGFVD